MGIWNKIKKQGNQEVKSENHSNDYFHNVVPPVSDLKEKDDTTLYDINNVEVTSSYIVNNNVKYKSNQQTPNDFSDVHFSDNPQRMNSNYHQEIGNTALISFNPHFKIPKAISFEIKTEKLKQLIFSFISIMGIAASTAFIILYFINFDLDYIPGPFISIPILIFAIAILFVNLIDYFSLKREVKMYITKTLKGSLMPPNFIIRNYRKIHARHIILNWFFIFTYVVLGLTTLILFLISGQKLTFLVQNWTVQVPDLESDAVTLSIVLGVLWFVHMTSFVLFRKRKSNITSFYGYEIINPQELEAYKKKINRICIIIVVSLVAIIFFAVVIPVLIFRRKKKIV